MQTESELTLNCRAQTDVWYCTPADNDFYWPMCWHTASLSLSLLNHLYSVHSSWQHVVSLTFSLPLMLPVSVSFFTRPGLGTDRSPIMTWWLFTSPTSWLSLSLSPSFLACERQASVQRSQKEDAWLNEWWHDDMSLHNRSLYYAFTLTLSFSLCRSDLPSWEL